MAALAEGSPAAKVKSEGAAQGVGPAALNAAVADAQAAAVVHFLQSAVATRDLSVFGDIIDDAPRYFGPTSVKKVDRSEGATRVEIEGELLEDRLRGDAAGHAEPTLVRPPQVVLLLAIRRGEQGEPAFDAGVPAEEALGRALADRNLTVRGRQNLANAYPDAELLARLHAEPAAAGRLALENLAEVAVLGEVVLTSEPGNGNVRANRVQVWLRVLRGLDGVVLLERALDAVVHGADEQEGLVQATRDACAKLAGPVAAAVVLGAMGARGGSDVLLTVEGAGVKERLPGLESALNGVLGVEQVDAVYVSDTLVRLRVRYAGHMEPFCDTLALQPHPGYRLLTRRVIGREVEMALEARESAP